MWRQQMHGYVSGDRWIRIYSMCDTRSQEAGEAAPSSPSQQSRELKAVYREQYTELQAVKAEADYTQKLAEQCMQELVLDFQAW